MTNAEFLTMINTDGLIPEIVLRKPDGTPVYINGFFHNPAIHPEGQYSFTGKLTKVGPIVTVLNGRGISNLMTSSKNVAHNMLMNVLIEGETTPWNIGERSIVQPSPHTLYIDLEQPA